MLEDARERAEWKVRWLGLTEGLGSEVSRPVHKLIRKAGLGILGSGSLKLAEVARALKEPMRVHHTQKRLSRMLGRHSEVAYAAGQLQLERVGAAVSEAMILAIDPGDLNRDGATHSEWRGRVRDGSTWEIVGDYPLFSVVARDVKRRRTLPLLTRLGASARAGYESENADIAAVVHTVERHLKVRPLWVMDRGGDRGILWRLWDGEDREALVRVTNRRYWLWRDRKKTAQQIARSLPLKHQGRLRRGCDKAVRFGITRVTLPQQPETPLWMIVVRHGAREPLVLVTTRPVRGRHHGQWMIYAYLDRWACEEGYRFTKQGFRLESVAARRFAVPANLVPLASLAWLFWRCIRVRHWHSYTMRGDKSAGRHRLLCFIPCSSVGNACSKGRNVSIYHRFRAPPPHLVDRNGDLFASHGLIA